MSLTSCLWRLRFSLAVLVLGAAPVQAATVQQPAAKPTLRALVVGVSGYHQVGWTPLIGAWNDAALIAARLITLGARPEDLTLLIDRPTPAMLEGLPADTLRELAIGPSGTGTRAAILAGLERLAAQSRAGDEVVVAFSGHGFQQKERVAGSEPDGLDEIFMPFDSGSPNTDGSPHQNAILDDEIGAALDAIRRKGANVTYIGDFCHSGDSNRGSSGGSPPGKAVLDPAARRFTVSTDGTFRKDLAVEANADQSGWGSYVGLMAAPADVQAQQYSAPAFASREHRKPQGALTAYAMANLLNPRVFTYRDLASRITANISQFHRNAPRPLFDGALDRPLLGGLPGQKAAEGGGGSWTVVLPRVAVTEAGKPAAFDQLEISGGVLDGLVDGSVVALSMTTVEGEKPLLYGEVTGAGSTSAKLKPVDFGEIGADRWRDVRDQRGRPFTGGARLIATLVRQPVQLDVRIALPADVPEKSPLQTAVLHALSRLRPETIGAMLVPSGSRDADLVLAFEGDRLFVRDPARVPAIAFGAIDLAAAAERGGGSEQALQFGVGNALLQAARFQRLRRVLSSPNLDGDEGGLNPARQLDVKLFLWRPTTAAPAAADCPRPPLQGYRVIPEARPVDQFGATDEGGMLFRRCDVLFIEFTNRGKEELYVNPLIFSPDGRILLASAKVDRSVRFAPGEKGVIRYGLTDAEADAQLRDDLFLLVSEARDGAAVSFDTLAQPCSVATAYKPDCGSPSMASRTLRSGGAAVGGVQALIDAALLSTSTRGAALEPTRTGAIRLSWRTVPR